MEITEVTVERVQPDIFIVVPEVAAVTAQPSGRYEPAGEFDGTKLFRNELALPRALLVSQATVLQDPGEVLQRLQSDDFDPRREVVLEGSGAPSQRPMATATNGEDGPCDGDIHGQQQYGAVSAG